MGKKKQGGFWIWVSLVFLILGLLSLFISETFFGVLFIGIGIILFIAFGEEPVKRNTVAQRQGINNDDTHHRDPVLHYEVTKGHFGDSSKQSLTYSGKKTRWR